MAKSFSQPKKLVIVGDGGCGKTSLLFAFGANAFLLDHEPTVFENYTTTVTVNNQNIELSLWDTAGQEDLDRLRPLSYANADVILICFSICDVTSFINVADKWVPEVKHYRPTVPLILVATKRDLRYDQLVTKKLAISGRGTLKSVEGESLATRINAVAYIECSSKTYEGVKTVFQTAAWATLKLKYLRSVLYVTEWTKEKGTVLLHPIDTIYAIMPKDI